MVNRQELADPNVSFLAEVASSIESEYTRDLSDWEESPFSWIMSHPAATRGAVGKRLVSCLLDQRGLAVGSCPGRGADRLVNGRRVAIKFSMIWEGGFYRFQQIRDQDYDMLVCLGVSPFDAHSWVFTKTLLLEGWNELDGFGSQHGGHIGTDTAWIHVNQRLLKLGSRSMVERCRRQLIYCLDFLPSESTLCAIFVDVA